MVQRIREDGGKAIAHCGSVTSWEDSQGLIQAALDSFGRIDILVNHGNGVDAPGSRMICEISEEEWVSAVRACLKAVFLCTRAALPHMRRQGQGRLIHFTSAEALIGSIGHTHHGAARMAVAGLSRNAAIEGERCNVTSNCIVLCNGGKQAASGGLAPLVVYLASDAARNLSGQLFGTRDKEVFLFSQARIERSIHNSEGWTVERLSAVFESMMRPYFTSVEDCGSYFC